MSRKLESVAVYVLDAVGDKWCYSVSDPQYRGRAVKHAQWWARQRNHKGFDGKPLAVCYPVRVVVEEIFSED